MDSILDSVKKALGLESTYTPFDTAVLMYINGVFSTLHDLGFGPPRGFMIADSTPTWDAFLGDGVTEDDFRLNAIKTYIYLRVRLLFDPPSSSFVLTSFQEQIRELEWRLNALRESYTWVQPVLVEYEPVGYVVDGGGAD